MRDRHRQINQLRPLKQRMRGRALTIKKEKAMETAGKQTLNS